jgi:predicted ATPase
MFIDIDDLGRPFVSGECLLQHPKNQKHGQTTAYLTLINGNGVVWKGEGKEIEDDKDGIDFSKVLSQEAGNFSLFLKKMALEPGAESVELSDKRKLGIATLGAMKQHPRISAFRQFIEGWYLSYFTPDAARSLPQAGAQQHLNSKGDNLANVVQFMEREHRDSFQNILNRIAEKIPGIDKIDTYRDPITNNLYLRFNDKGFKSPFYAPQMSDGTLKVFAYLLLLEDPAPSPFICIEEPENGLYHKLLETLAAEFRTHATGCKGGSQLFITTHQPYFVDALDPEEVWVLEKGEDGFSTVTRASDIPYIQNMVNEGLPLGGLWYSDYLDAR